MQHDDRGQGERVISRTDLALQARALRERWPIPTEVRRTIIETAVDLCTARSPEGDLKARHRTVVAALKVLAIFDQLSLEQRKIDTLRKPSRGRAGAAAADGLAPEDAARILSLINEHEVPHGGPRDPAGDR